MERWSRSLHAATPHAHRVFLLSSLFSPTLRPVPPTSLLLLPAFHGSGALGAFCM
jgi:hypothetical protein